MLPVCALGVTTEPASVQALPVLAAPSETLKMPLPVGTSIQIAWPSMAPGKAVAVAARCPAVAWNVTPGVVSANGAPELPSPPNSDTPYSMAWLDLRGYGHDNAAAVAYAGGVRLSAGTGYQPDLPGHARLNFATSPERLTEIIRRLGVAFTS